ncbi:MAG: HEAT repeat domain-containing protein [Longimicrobiales bacterium]
MFPLISQPVLSLLASLTLAVGIGPDTLEAVDLYGLRTLAEAVVRATVGLAAGDPVPDSLERIRQRLLDLPEVAAVDVSIVCCGEMGGSILYVGIREEGMAPIAFRAAPAGAIRLRDAIVELGARFEGALLAAVRRGATGEDDSQGYALSSDSVVRSVQKAFLEVARTDFDTLVAVVRSSSDAAHRALAAQVLAYGAERQAVVRALVHAVGDPSESVRNNAARALALVAGWASKNPQAGLSIPTEPFVDFLNSVSWTDRNKGVLVLIPLTAERDSTVLAELRKRALPSLVEMGRWSNPGHALGPYILLARLGGVEDGEAFRAWQAGERETIITRALEASP